MLNKVNFLNGLKVEVVRKSELDGKISKYYIESEVSELLPAALLLIGENSF